MTRDSDFIGLLEGYLDDFEGHTPLPDASRDEIRARLPMTPQRPAWWPGWRSLDMNTTTRFALGAAAAVLVAIVGYTMLSGGGPNVGTTDPTDPAGPPPTVEPTASSAAELPSQNGLAAGTYYIDLRPHRYEANGDYVQGTSEYRVSFELPAGWNGLGWAANKVDSVREATALTLDTPTVVFNDPCNFNAGSSMLKDSPEMRDPAGFTAKLAELWQGAGQPTQTTIAGHAASYIEIVTPDDTSFADCYGNKFQVWTGRWLQEPGQRLRLWVIETDDGLVLFESSLEPNASSTEVAEADAIMASMAVEKLEASAP